MYKPYRYQPYLRSLIESIGGASLPGESRKLYFGRVGDIVGLGPLVIRTIYHGQDTEDGRYIYNNGQYLNKEHLNKLEQAAENARDTWAIIAFTENQLAIWETDPVRFRSRIDAAREFLGRLRQSPEVVGQNGFSLRNGDAPEED